MKQIVKIVNKCCCVNGVSDDPRISAIKVIPTNGYYWDTKHNMAIGLVKRINGAAIGKTFDDSVEGTIKLQKASNRKNILF